MKVIIIGKGIVGRATALTLNYKADIEWHDPPQGLYADLDKADIIFICCPSHLVEKYLQEFDIHSNVFIRSTIKPTILEGFKVAVYPEFLTERRWKVDATDPLCIVFGGSDNQLKLLKSCSKLKMKNIYMTDNKTAALMKIITNAYTSSKIIFFTQVYNLCKKLNMDYEELRKCITTDPRIHENGTFIPGPDGQLGFGGKCFPKDTQYLLDLIDNQLLKVVIKENNELRNK